MQWAARYAGCAWTALAIALRGLRTEAQTGTPPCAAGVAPERPTPARLKVLEAAAQPLPGAELGGIAVSAGVVKGPLTSGALDEVWVTPGP